MKGHFYLIVQYGIRWCGLGVDFQTTCRTNTWIMNNKTVQLEQKEQHFQKHQRMYQIREK